MGTERRAPREEIFAHLQALLGKEAVFVATQVAIQHKAGEKDMALSQLKEYDAFLGGIGIYASQG